MSDVMTPGMRMALASVAQDLNKRFHGVFGLETSRRWDWTAMTTSPLGHEYGLACALS
jgi:hypothetical protein